MTKTMRNLRRDNAGSTIVEFAILAPMVVTMLLGVMQVGMWMQGYNTLRAVAADTGRQAVVQYQRGNKLSNYDMAVWARNQAMGSGYQLIGDRVTTTVVDDANQPITGVTRKTLTINYRMPSILGIAGVNEIDVAFSRPIFVSSS